MDQSKSTWYDTILNLDEPLSEWSATPSLLCKTQTELLQNSENYLPSVPTSDCRRHTSTALRVLIQSTRDIMEQCTDDSFDMLRKVIESTDHTYFVLTQHPLSFAQKRLFLKENVWTGIRFSSTAGLPFGTSELLKTVPNSNWFFHIDLCEQTNNIPFELFQGVKWLVLDCDVAHKPKAARPSLPCIRHLIRCADEACVPVYMSQRLQAMLPASDQRNELPDKQKVRMSIA